jgi:hypothetical protein
MFKRLHRDEVFIAGGEPKTTYVDRQESHVERNLARAIASPNQIVSVAGPTKTGKTVLCKRILGDREYVWIDGGVVQSAQQLWDEVSGELRIPYQTSDSTDHTSGLDGVISSPIVSVKRSKLRRRSSSESHLQTMGDAHQRIAAGQYNPHYRRLSLSHAGESHDFSSQRERSRF